MGCGNLPFYPQMARITADEISAVGRTAKYAEYTKGKAFPCFRVVRLFRGYACFFQDRSASIREICGFVAPGTGWIDVLPTGIGNLSARNGIYPA